MESNEYHDELLAKYIAGELSEQEKLVFEQWRNASAENQEMVVHAEKVSFSLSLLKEMKQYNVNNALEKISTRTSQSYPSTNRRFIYFWQKVAAILLLPLLIVSAFYLFNQKSDNSLSWQTITTPPGLRSQTKLADGTVVWLNSGSSLRYPANFSGKERIVELKGEAYFSVAEDKNHPFIVESGKIGVKVLGTEFNVSNYNQEGTSEVVLATGKVELFEINGKNRKAITEMAPGQQMVYSKTKNQYLLNDVDPDKYISWIEGKLIFRDDQMKDVIRRLNRWYNVDIETSDAEISQYVYTATFQYETIVQILELFKKTSPIEYTIQSATKNDDGSFGKQKIILKKRI